MKVDHRPWLGSRSLLRLGLCFFSLSLIIGVFVLRSKALFWFLDGSWQLDAMRSEDIWGGGVGVWTYNPLRGLFNFFPLGDYNDTPVVFLARHIAGLANVQVAIFVGYTLLIFAVLGFACVSLRIPVVLGVIATLVSLALATPLGWEGPSIILPIFVLAPHTFELSISFAFLTLSFALLSPNAGMVRRAAVPTALLAMAWVLYFLFLMPQFVLVLLPPLLFALVLLTVLSGSRAEFVTKLLLLSLLVFAAFFSGIIDFARNFVGNTSAAFFSAEMPIYDGGLTLSSMLYELDRPLGALLSVASGLGSSYVCWKWRKGLRSDPRVQLSAVNTLLTLGMWLLFPLMWTADKFICKLPFLYSLRLIYFEYVFYLFTCFFASLSLAFTVVFLVRLVFSKRSDAKRLEHVANGICALIILGILWNVLHDPRSLRNPYPYPPKSSEITSFLAPEIGVLPGQPFRGRVATISNDEGRPGPFGWEDSVKEDMKEIQLTENDHRFGGLWYFNIPTLQEFTPIVLPATYLLETRFLANPHTLHNTRNTVLLTQVNDMLLRLLGVRFLIAGSNNEAHIGVERARAGNRILYEISDANTSGWAVRKVERVEDASEALLKMKVGADLQEIAYVTSNQQFGDLHPSTTTLTLLRGSVRVSARSSGKAFIVLPIQFSRCFRVRTDHGEEPAAKLVRTDLALTGVLVADNADFEIAMATGPGDHGRCLREDTEELEAMKLSDAAKRFPLPSAAEGRAP